jgi:hypothetical protein
MRYICQKNDEANIPASLKRDLLQLMPNSDDICEKIKGENIKRKMTQELKALTN